ncbi:response regulator transcription factor, partial [Streptomyces sp. NPDC051445]|uniref:response regulator transcription factor n=1 Tax=Streptomyces sp. NPDC051445 TaxID=3365653 RepID=UPI00379B8855
GTGAADGAVGPCAHAGASGAHASQVRPAPGHAGAAYDARGVQAASGPADRGSRALDGTGAADGAVGPCAHAGASGAHASQVRPAPGHADAAQDARAVHDPYTVYDAVRLGVPEQVVGLLPSDGCFGRHARALVRGDGPALDLVAAELEGRGFLLFAAEAYAQAVRVHRDPGAARTARTRAVALARRCQGARTPALSGLVLGELTARQRQIVTLAAAGLSNRQIAERLTLSVRTVGNHLYGAYTRLGAGDRAALPRLVEQPA